MLLTVCPPNVVTEDRVHHIQESNGLILACGFRGLGTPCAYKKYGQIVCASRDPMIHMNRPYMVDGVI